MKCGKRSRKTERSVFRTGIQTRVRSWNRSIWPADDFLSAGFPFSVNKWKALPRPTAKGGLLQTALCSPVLKKIFRVGANVVTFSVILYFPIIWSNICEKPKYCYKHQETTIPVFPVGTRRGSFALFAYIFNMLNNSKDVTFFWKIFFGVFFLSLSPFT